MVRIVVPLLLFAAQVLLVPAALAVGAPAPPDAGSVSLNVKMEPPSGSHVSAEADGSGRVEASVSALNEAEKIRLRDVDESLSSPQEAKTLHAVPKWTVVPAETTRAAVGLALIVALIAAVKFGVMGSLAFPLFSRIEGNHLLDHDMRRRIHETILAGPGITIKEITTSLHVGWGTAVHHLRRLEKGGLVVSQRHRQFRRFYDARGGISRAVRDASAELIHPTSERIAAEVVQHPGAPQNAVAQAVGISAGLAHKYLTRLESAQLLTRERDLKMVRCFPTARLLEMLAAPTAVPLIAA